MNANRNNAEMNERRPEPKNQPLRNRLYDRLPFSVDQVEKFIIFIAALIVILILVGIFMN